MVTLLDVLGAYVAVNDPWVGGYADRKAAATEALLAEVGAMADAGERDALRVWARLSDEQAYAARNAAADDRMHRKVPEYGPIVHSEHARLTADRDGIPEGADTAWCSTCRTRREVVDVDNHASYYSGSHEVEVTATHLACSHTESSPERVVGPSPGGEAAAEAMAGARTQARLARSAAMQDDAPPW